MSEPTDPKPAPSAKPPRTRGQKWRRRLIITLVVIICLSVIARLMVSVLLPPVLRKVARGFGLTAQYDKLDLYALNGDIGLWNLRFTPLDSDHPVIRTSYCRGSISALALLRGKLEVNRLEAEDAEVLLERDASGNFPLLKGFASATPAATPTAAPTASKPSAMSLDAPLRIDVLRLQNGRLRLRDAAISPATDVSLLADVLLTNVGSTTDKTRLEVQLHSPEALAALYISATGTSRDNQLDADLAVRMYGLNLKPAQAYLAPLGLLPITNDLAGQMNGHLTAKLNTPPGGDATTPPKDLSATLHLSDLQLTNENKPVAGVKAIDVSIPSLAPGAIRIDSVAITGVRGNASRTKDGRVSVAGIELVPVPPSAAMPVTVPVTVPATQPVSPAPSGASPIVELKTFTIDDVALQFDDQATPEPTRIQLQASNFTLAHVSTDPAQVNEPATISLNAVAPGIAKAITLTGTAMPMQRVKHVDLTLDIAGLSAAAIKPYLAAMGITSELADGHVTCTIAGQAETKADGSLLAGASVKDLHLSDGPREWFTLPSVMIDSAAVSADQQHIRIGSIAVVGPTLPIQREADGSFALLGMQIGAAPTSSSATPSPTSSPTTLPALAVGGTTQPATLPKSAVVAAVSLPAAKPSVLPSIEIDHFTWTNAGVALRDLQAGDPLKLAVQDVSVDIEHLTFDPAGKSAQPGSIKVSVRSPGVIEKFDLAGTLSPGDGVIAFDVSAQSTGVTAAAL